ncbi:MAG: tRNA pseudouridine(38-40) synthase TruA [Alicyclobacillus sp.]|nr:tRNA pseudouridine(38-40) synthase TruA [Alicyclobacillus sp.]
MPRIKLEIAYDGTDFHGFAKQRGLRTVQGVLEETLARILKCSVEVYGSGRTDAGVHARAQVVHFDVPYGPPADKYVYMLRRGLPRDVVAVRAEQVPDSFHARFSVRRKTYRYTVQTAPVPDIFTQRYSWHEPLALDIGRMRAEAVHLVGEHDFTSFCAAATPVEDKRRTLYRVDVVQDGSYVHIWCTGNGFLQYMVRIIAGTLVDAGAGRLRMSVRDILAACDRTRAGRTAPPWGLALWAVDYGTVDDAIRP